MNTKQVSDAKINSLRRDHEHFRMVKDFVDCSEKMQGAISDEYKYKRETAEKLAGHVERELSKYERRTGPVSSSTKQEKSPATARVLSLGGARLYKTSTGFTGRSFEYSGGLDHLLVELKANHADLPSTVDIFVYSKFYQTLGKQYENNMSQFLKGLQALSGGKRFRITLDRIYDYEKINQRLYLLQTGLPNVDIILESLR